MDLNQELSKKMNKLIIWQIVYLILEVVMLGLVIWDISVSSIINGVSIYLAAALILAVGFTM